MITLIQLKTRAQNEAKKARENREKSMTNFHPRIEDIQKEEITQFCNYQIFVFFFLCSRGLDTF